jgi:sec-independent protein translocase protein TatC
MTFTEHLAELRGRLIRSVAVVVVCMAVCFFAYHPIFNLLSRPLAPLIEQGVVQEAADTATGAASRPRASWQVLDPLEPFRVNLKLAAYCGLLLALPYLVYQVCAFIFPGLKPRERRAVLFLIAGCGVLTLAGLCVAYFGVFPLVLPYLAQYAPGIVELNLQLSRTVNTLLLGLLGFAIAFQFPMAVFILVYMNLLTPDTLKKWRRVAIVLMMVVSAFLTPPDPFSMLLMGGPLVLLYELSIWMAQLLVWKRERAARKRGAGT